MGNPTLFLADDFDDYTEIDLGECETPSDLTSAIQGATEHALRVLGAV